MSILPLSVPEPTLAAWAQGHDGHGHPVRPEIRAAAQLRLAGQEPPQVTDDDPDPYGEPDWDETDWDDVQGHLSQESPWFAKIMSGESPGDPDDDADPSAALPTQQQVRDSMAGAVLKFTPHTAEASTVHQPTVPPGGPGLFHMKGHQLPPYVQHLYKHLVGKYGKHRAYGVAIGIVKKWAAGINPGGKGKGHKVHADVQAAAAKNVGEWEKEKAEAHAHHKGKDAKASNTALDRVLSLAAGRPPERGAPESEADLHPLKPVPANARAIFTAHRVDDIVSQLSHACERAPLAQAAKGAERNYHMTHVANHMVRVDRNCQFLADNLKRNYPPESTELDAIQKLIKLAKSTSEPSKAATTAHLLQTVSYHMGHASRHAEACLKCAPSSKDWDFNAEHAARHVNGAHEHALKLAQHIKDNYPDEWAHLSGLATGRQTVEGVQLAHPYTRFEHGVQQHVSGYLGAFRSAGAHTPQNRLENHITQTAGMLPWTTGARAPQPGTYGAVAVSLRNAALAAGSKDYDQARMHFQAAAEHLSKVTASASSPQEQKRAAHVAMTIHGHRKELEKLAAERPRVALAAPAAVPSGKPYKQSFLPPIGPSGLKQGSITNPGVIGAPGAKPMRVPFGNPVLQQAPSQTVAAGPPLPPAVSLPTSKEITALIKQVPDEPDVTLASGIKKHLTAAARKASLGDNIGALAAMRSVQTGVHAGYRAAVMANVPNEAAVFSAAGFAGKVDNPDAVKARDSGRQLILDYRQLHHDVAGHIDRFRRTYFHGQYNNTAELRMSLMNPAPYRFNLEDALRAPVRYPGGYEETVKHATGHQLKHFAKSDDPGVARNARAELERRGALPSGINDQQRAAILQARQENAEKQHNYAENYFTPEERSVRGRMSPRGSGMERVKAHERRGPTGKMEYVRESYRHMNPDTLRVWNDDLHKGLVDAHEADGGMLRSLGHVERHGLMWHGVHKDGTDTGAKADKKLAAGAILDYHNQQADAHVPDPEKIAQLEAEADRLDPLNQLVMDKLKNDPQHMTDDELRDAYRIGVGRDDGSHRLAIVEAERRGKHTLFMSPAEKSEYDTIRGMSDDDLQVEHEHLLDSLDSDYEGLDSPDIERRFVAVRDEQKRRTALPHGKPAEPQQGALFSGTTESALQLTRNVKSYTRIEGGHLETVRAYSAAGNPKMNMHLKYLNRLLGGGKKYTPGQGFFIDSKGEKHWGWHGAAGLLVHNTDEQGVTRYLLQRRTGSVQHGGTWSTPGGAIDLNTKTGKIETPEEAAFREGGEEFGPEFKSRAQGMQVTSHDTQPFGEPGTVGYWAYHTIHVKSPEQFDPTKGKKGKDSWEAGGYKWVTPKEMAKLPLHPGFRPAALKLGMPDVPNPAPYSDQPYKTYGTGSSGSNWVNKDPMHPDDFIKGQRVTWRHGKQTMSGEITGPGATVQVKGGFLPGGYMVKGDKGFEGEVKWEQLRLESLPKGAKTGKPAETPKAPPSAAATPVKGAAPPKPSTVPPTAQKAMSKMTPGMSITVPSGVRSVYEHPQGDQLIIETSNGKFYAYDKGKIQYESKQPKPPWAKMTLQAPGGSVPAGGSWQAGASTGTGFAGKVTSAVKGAKGSQPAEDPYWASQAQAAGLNPYAKKLPPGPVVPAVKDRKLFDTVHAENQRIAAADQKKQGPRSNRARSGIGAMSSGTSRSYAPHRLAGKLTRPSDPSVPLPHGHPGLRKPKAPGARRRFGGE